MEFIDLNALPAPEVVETLAFEHIFARRKEKFLSLIEDADKPSWEALLQLESEPVVKLLQESAYLELLLRERVNVAATSNMIAFAKNADLDHLVANYNIKRLLIKAEDITTNTPAPAIYESDDALRQRALQAFEGLTNAGTVGAYKYHTFSADAKITDVGVSRPQAGTVLVSVLSNENKNPADVSDALLLKINDHLNAEDVRPLTDTIQVKAALAVNYQIKANIKTLTGVSGALSQEKINQSLESLINHTKIGQDITRSHIISVLHQEGVYSVELVSPAKDIKVNETQIAVCTSSFYEIEGDDA